MKKLTKITIALTILILLIVSVKISSSEKKIILVSFTLSNKTGFNLKPNELSFGKITPNQSATRSIILQNLDKQKVKVKIEASKNISDYIIVTENNFFLSPNETKSLAFTIFTDGLTEFREYTGAVTITTKKNL